MVGGFSSVIGRFGGPTVSSMEVYDPASNAWNHSLSGMHTARNSHCCIEYEGNAWAIGGLGGFGPLRSVEIYNPYTDQWREGPSLLTARYDAACVSVRGSLHVIGGRGTEHHAQLSTTEVYDPSLNRWVRGSPTPRPIKSHTALCGVF